MRLTVHFEKDGEGRPRGAVAAVGESQSEHFHGWLELLRALQRLASADDLLPLGQAAAD